MVGAAVCPNGHGEGEPGTAFCERCGSRLVPRARPPRPQDGGGLGLTPLQTVLAAAGAIAMFGGALGSSLLFRDEPANGAPAAHAQTDAEPTNRSAPSPSSAASKTATPAGRSPAATAAATVAMPTTPPTQPPAAAGAGLAPTATPRPPTATLPPPTATKALPTATRTATPIVIQIAPVPEVTAYFGVGYRVGQELQFCWQVTPENRPYTYLIRQLSPVQGIVRASTQHAGGDDCMNGLIQSSDVGTLTVRIELTLDGQTASAQASKTILP